MATSIKIARTQKLNPKLKVFLCLLGDDVLKAQEQAPSMIGGHSPNMAADEMRRMLGVAMRIDEIFRRYPELERHAQRLNFTRSRDADHIAPRNYFLFSLKYRSNGLHLLKKVKSRGATVFVWPLPYRGIDGWIVRPCDLLQGRPRSCPKEVDRSITDASDASIVLSEEDRDNDFDLESLDPAQILAFDGEAVLAAERKEAEQTSHAPHSVWMTLDDSDPEKKVHKASALRTMMDPTLDIDRAKGHDRLLRIRCFSIGGDSWDRSKGAQVHDTAVSGEHLLRAQGLFAALVCVNKAQVSLAVLQCVGLKCNRNNPPTYLDSAPIAELPLSDAKYEITGQILALEPFVDTSQSLSWGLPRLKLENAVWRRDNSIQGHYNTPQIST
ncbi:hypothetical protein R3P38DRAFT_2533569 [Favolaschia claudopus]|uniref:Uncharacterized protein n=1 Tax=Favolaschia claudopus TaxID=2862362 RepID=A0AAW0B6I5_9AGAR